MATPNPGTVVAFQAALHAQLIPYIAALHASCITHDHTPATFVPPLSHEKLLYWWKDRIAEVSAGTRLIFLLVRNDLSSSITVDVSPIKGADLLGVAMLDLPTAETDLFRASVEQLLIHTTYRRQGGAKSLIQTIETEAILRGKTLLTLNVESDSPAETFFSSIGYTEVGKIPGYYSTSPRGDNKGAALFYKQLES